MYLLNVGTKGFGVGVVGYVQLVVAKGRGGTFQRGAIAADIRLDATTTPYTGSIDAPRDGDTYSPKIRRRNSEERVTEVLTGSSVGLNAGEVHRLVNGSDQRHPEEGEISIGTVQNTLTKWPSGRVFVMSGGKKDPGGKFITATWQKTGHDPNGQAP